MSTSVGVPLVGVGKRHRRHTGLCRHQVARPIHARHHRGRLESTLACGQIVPSAETTTRRTASSDPRQKATDLVKDPIMFDRRPAVVTFIGVVIYIQAAFDLIIAAVAFNQRNDTTFQNSIGQSASELTAAAIVLTIAGTLLLLVGSGVMTGARWARFAVAVVQTIRLATSLYLFLNGFGGGFQWNAIITAGIAVFVLWGLYGNIESGRYFRRIH